MLSFREFYAALYAKFPPDSQPVVESDQPFFDEEELLRFRDMEALSVSK